MIHLGNIQVVDLFLVSLVESQKLLFVMQFTNLLAKRKILLKKFATVKVCKKLKLMLQEENFVLQLFMDLQMLQKFWMQLKMVQNNMILLKLWLVQVVASTVVVKAMLITTKLMLQKLSKREVQASIKLMATANLKKVAKMKALKRFMKKF